MEGASEALNELMVALGFDAYVVQGGDVGSFLSQTICGLFEECKAFHCEFGFSLFLCLFGGRVVLIQGKLC
jgi:microsomal epoxide hydrolase